MIIYENGKVRVVQHQHLPIFYVQRWDLGDNPRSYGQCYKWCTILETRNIDEVNKKVKELLN